MKRSLWRLCQSREKAAGSSAYQGVVCEADAASVASQDVFKVRGEGSGVLPGGVGWRSPGWRVAGVKPDGDMMLPMAGTWGAASGQGA